VLRVRCRTDQGLRMILLDYRQQAWAPIKVVLDVIVTFSWMAFLGYGLIALIFWAFRMLH
jgi:hypothetical protein